MCDKIKHVTLLSIIGNTLQAISFLLFGPVPFISWKPNLKLTWGMMVVMGIGDAMVMVSTFCRIHRAAIKFGFKDDIKTHLLVSVLWTTAFSLGVFLGSTVSGWSVDIYGFRWTAMIFFGIYCAAIILDSFDLTSQISTRKNDTKHH